MELLETKRNENGGNLASRKEREIWVEAQFQGQGCRSGMAISGTNSSGQTVPDKAVLGSIRREGPRHIRVQLGIIGLYCKGQLGLGLHPSDDMRVKIFLLCSTHVEDALRACRVWRLGRGAMD
jgi:hypothetical protein